MPFQVEVLRMPESPWWRDWLPIIVAFVSGLIFPAVAKALQQWLFYPRLKVLPVFTKTMKVRGKGNGYWPSEYVRIPVRNTSLVTAKDAKAYLEKLEEFDGSEFKEATFFQDTIRLRWAYEPQEEELHAGIEIPNNVTFHVDVMSVKREDDPQPARIIQCADKFFRFQWEGGLVNRLNSETRYRFHIALTAENAATRRVALDVAIGPSWELKASMA